MADPVKDPKETQSQISKIEGQEHSPVAKLPASVLDGRLHFGIEITVTASGKLSTIVIPDAGEVGNGAPIYITGPIGLQGENLKEFLKAKGVELPSALEGLIKNTTITCDAFYYSTKPVTFKKGDGSWKELKDRLKLSDADWNALLEKLKNVTEYKIEEGPLLMMFTIDFDGGLIQSLTGDEHIGKLFDVTRGSIRVLRCPQDRQDILKDYVKQLEASS